MTPSASHWRQADSSELTLAVEQYLRAPSAMTERDIVVMRAYLRQWIMSPAFDDPRFAGLRETVNAPLSWGMSAHIGLRNWIQRAIEIGAGPL